MNEETNSLIFNYDLDIDLNYIDKLNDLTEIKNKRKTNINNEIKKNFNIKINQDDNNNLEDQTYIVDNVIKKIDNSDIHKIESDDKLITFEKMTIYELIIKLVIIIEKLFKIIFSINEIFFIMLSMVMGLPKDSK